MKQQGAPLARALEWIARLPLSGEPDLSRLLGIDGIAARHLIHELTQRGWVESIEPGSPELELRRLTFMREQALPALAAALGVAPPELTRALPVRLRDVLVRVSSVEITAATNRFFAELTSDLRRSRVAELVDARSLPLAVPAAERWWLPSTEGYGCLRAGKQWAPFLVAWDRAATPDLYRRRRVAAWSAAAAAIDQRWGREGLPSILVACPSERAMQVWEQALLDRNDGAADRIDVLLTTRGELHARGAGGAVWRRPGLPSAAPLIERLGWSKERSPVPSIRLPDVIDDIHELPRTARSVREWAAAHATASVGSPTWQRVAVLALATSAGEKRLIEWVARHPLLSTRELAALLNESTTLIERRLDWLTRCGAVRAEAATSTSESEDEGTTA